MFECFFFFLLGKHFFMFMHFLYGKSVENLMQNSCFINHLMFENLPFDFLVIKSHVELVQKSIYEDLLC